MQTDTTDESFGAKKMYRKRSLEHSLNTSCHVVQTMAKYAVIW